MDNDSGSPINISIGKEIDRSLAEVMTALLKPPATEIGGLLGDGIGILSDLVRRKREVNAHLGMAEVRRKLEAADVGLDQITPPDAEDIHLLVTGLSLTDDENLRGMWAGLFAQALHPASDVTAERPYISLLQSLSPTDAKVIHFLVYAETVEAELKASVRQVWPKDMSNITTEEKQQIEAASKRNEGLRDEAIIKLLDSAKTFGLDTLAGNRWAENLMRQGIMEHRVELRRPPNRFSGSLNTERDFVRAFQFFGTRIDFLDRQSALNATLPDVLIKTSPGSLQVNVTMQLTDFGQRFATACGVEGFD